MSYTITLGWWLAPSIMTALAFSIAAFMGRSDGRPDQYGAGAILSLVLYLVAAVFSLIAWLLWAVLG